MRLLVHLALLLPLAVLLWDGAQGRLTANPIEASTLRTGKTALVLLVLSLACRPAYDLSGRAALLWLRRTLGLYAFGYAAVHLLIFVGLDYGFDLSLLPGAVLEKRFALAGLAAFLLLLPLALTSTAGWRRRLGRTWAWLHRLVYLAALADVVHYVWLVKIDRREPLLFGALVLLLLLLRLVPLRRVLASRSGFVR